MLPRPRSQTLGRPPPTSILLEDVVGALNEVRRHDIRLFLNLETGTLEDRLALEPAVRPVIFLDLRGIRAGQDIVEAAITQLARAVAGLWPYPWGEDFSGFGDDGLSHAHLPIRVADLADRLRALSQSWACAAIPKLGRGKLPRVGRASPALEWAQLALAVAPGGLIIATPLAPDHATAAQVQALEWLGHHADVAVVVLAESLSDIPELDRILFGAKLVTRLHWPAQDAHEPVQEPPHENTSWQAGVSWPGNMSRREDDEPPILVLPPAPEGLPHPMSPIEQKLHKLIQADDELRPLFRFNKTVPLPLVRAKVDLVWIEGQVVVEIDGHEHRGTAKFRADRHRDYELMCAGYRVLRMTNQDVETDAALAIEKIRRVARLARTEAK